MSDTALEQFIQRRAERMEEQPRQFYLEGETLTVKHSIAPDVALRLARFREKILQFTASAQKAAEAGKPIPDAPFDDEEMIAVADDTARACLTPGSHAAWDRLRDPQRDNPLTIFDMYWLCDHLLGRAVEIPTVRPVGSSTGPARTNGSSKAGSRSKAGKR